MILVSVFLVCIYKGRPRDPQHSSGVCHVRHQEPQRRPERCLPLPAWWWITGETDLYVSECPSWWVTALCDESLTFVMSYCPLWWVTNLCDELLPFVMSYWPLWWVTALCDALLSLDVLRPFVMSYCPLMCYCPSWWVTALCELYASEL